MLFLIVIAVVMLVLLVKALIETAWGAVLMISGICLLLVGYSLKFIASIRRIFEATEHGRKVCYA